METKSLLCGIIGFILGGLLVSIAATTFDKPADKATASSNAASIAITTESLKNKSWDELDKAFISNMIEHHEGAVKMEILSKAR